MSRILHTVLCSVLLFGAAAMADGVSLDPVKNVKRATQERTDKLLQVIKHLKTTAVTQPCTGNVQSCAEDCISRFADGTCATYGADYCGPDAQCSINCTSRFADGSCADYGPDFCGPDAVCSEDCTSRFADGTCADYGPDVCY